MKFYLFFSHPAMCTGSQDDHYPTSLTSWIYTYNIQPCWSDLGSFLPEYTLFDGVLMAYVASLLLYFLNNINIFVKIYKQSYKASGSNPFINALATMAMWHAMLGSICQISVFYVRPLTYSPGLRRAVHSQLKDSLPRYNKDGFLLREAWDNTMADGCCGVDGYQDLSDVNMSIPDSCQSVFNNKTFVRGCANTVMMQVIDNEERRIHAVLAFIYIEYVTLVLLSLLLWVWGYCC